MRDFSLDDIGLGILGTTVGAEAIKNYALDPSKFVLEAGCGSGKFGINYALRFGCNVTLLDIDPDYIGYSILLTRIVESILDARLPVAIRKGDILSLPFKEKSFDLVFNEGVVEHWKDERRLKCIEEMVRVSRDCVLIITNDAEGERSSKRAQETSHTYLSMPEKETPYSMPELTENMEKAGLGKVTVYRFNEPKTQEYLIGVGYK